MSLRLLVPLGALIITSFYALLSIFTNLLATDKLFLTAIFGYMTVRLGYSLTRKKSLKRFMNKFKGDK